MVLLPAGLWAYLVIGGQVSLVIAQSIAHVSSVLILPVVKIQLDAEQKSPHNQAKGDLVHAQDEFQAALVRLGKKQGGRDLQCGDCPCTWSCFWK